MPEDKWEKIGPEVVYPSSLDIQIGNSLFRVQANSKGLVLQAFKKTGSPVTLHIHP